MKYILKLNQAKVQEARAKMHESYNGIIAITLTNEGTKENKAFRLHNITNEVVDLGLWDCDRILMEAEKIAYNAQSYFGISCTCTGEKSNNFNASREVKSLIMRNPIGIISRITGCKVVRINELV